MHRDYSYAVFAIFLILSMAISVRSEQIVTQNWLDWNYDINNEQVWGDGEELNYHVVEDITVDGTVYILERVTVEIDADWDEQEPILYGYRIYVEGNGSIQAVGGEEALITFWGGDGLLGQTAWGGIVFDGVEESHFKYTQFKNWGAWISDPDARTITVYNGGASFELCRFYCDGSPALAWRWQNEDEFSFLHNDCQILDEAGVWIEKGKADITDTYFNSSIGVRVGETGGETVEALIQRCRFEDIDYGVLMEGDENSSLTLLSSKFSAISATGVIVGSGTTQIMNCYFEEMDNGIVIESPHLIEVNNNILGVIDDAAIDIDPSAANDEIYIHNNIIFDVVNGTGIRVGANADNIALVFNTIASCSYGIVAQNDTRVYNNVFSDWGIIAVYYPNSGAAERPVDYNVYCDPFGERTGTYIWGGATSPGGGPDDVADERENDVGWPYFNPWIGENPINDDIACLLFSDAFIWEGRDFHLTDGYTLLLPAPEEGEAGVPCFTNMGLMDDWWDAPEEDFLYLQDPNGGDRRIRTARNIHNPNPPPPPAGLADAGAYGGYWGDKWTILGVPAVPVNEEVIATQWWDPYIAEYQSMRWLYEGDHPGREYFRLFDENLDIPQGEELYIPAGTCIALNGTITVNGSINCPGTEQAPIILACFDQGQSWGGLVISNLVDASDVLLRNTDLLWAECGIQFTGVQSSYGSAIIDSCYIDSCGIGVYANNSHLTLSNSNVTNSYTGTYYGTGVYLTNCSTGMVVMDSDTIVNNGVDGTYSSAGLYLYYSDPEIINCTIQDNTGAGIACFGSSPDLDTYGSTSSYPNTITSNGSGTQSGSDGAEIYLTYESYPDINYNNIVDYNTSPVGYMIYKDDVYNFFSINAENNYWGATPSSSFFYWGAGDAIDYDPYSSSQISDFDDYALGMYYWERGEYETALECFMDCAYDTSSYAVNAIHYMTGCVSEMEDGDFGELRTFLLDVSDEHESDEVAKVAQRFATHCYTSVGNYEAAMDEYDDARLAAENVVDSVMVVIDYLAVAELAGIDMVNGSANIHEQMRQAMDRLKDGQESEVALPEDFTVLQAYPNPFNSTTTIRFNLQNTGYLKAAVYDVNGREVAVLHDGVANQGAQSLAWNAIDVPSGIYFCRLESAGKVSTLKMTLMK